MAKSYNNLALNYRDKGEYDDAIKWMKDAEEIFKTSNTSINELALLYFNLGNVYKKKGDNYEAKENYEKCIKSREQSKPVK